jgi:5-methylcytosine-specific restriction endonuclease McrA
MTISVEKICIVQGCDKLMRYRGLCNGHYLKYLRGRAPELETIILPVTVKTRAVCTYPNCKFLQHARSLCEIHYKQYRRENKWDTTASDKYRGSAKGRYKELKHAALAKGEFNISLEQHIEILKHPCAYCDGPLNKGGSGLDRKDTSKSYILDNVVPCCYSCNKIKSDELSYEEMLVAMEAILKLRRSVVITVGVN